MSKKKGTLSALAVVLLVSACGGPEATPPKYPYPEPTPVEDTELGVYLEEDEGDDLEDEESDDAE